LILLYVLSIVFRFIQVGLFYPIFSRIGLKSNWREAIFLSYGGIRGAVSIALALNFYREVYQNSIDARERQSAASFMFMAGGVSLLSLMFKGTTAGPVLKALSLGKRATTGRERLLQLFDRSAEEFILEEYVRLLSQPRFEHVHVKTVEAHVPFLNTENCQAEEENIDYARRKFTESLSTNRSLAAHTNHRLTHSRIGSNSESSNALVEMRQLFLELLTEAYDRMEAKGELDNKEHRGFNADVLTQSVAFAYSAVTDGPINDWEYTNMFPFHRDATAFIRFGRRGSRRYAGGLRLDDIDEYHKLKLLVLRAVCFVEGHSIAEEKLQRYLPAATFVSFLEFARKTNEILTFGFLFPQHLQVRWQGCSRVERNRHMGGSAKNT